VIVEWDDRRAAANAKKHGVTFQEAATVLEHTLSITFRDPDHSIEEFRFLTIGLGSTGRILNGGSHRPRGSRSANLGQASYAK
jgi:uncharacterized DUF497 family protein